MKTNVGRGYSYISSENHVAVLLFELKVLGNGSTKLTITYNDSDLIIPIVVEVLDSLLLTGNR